MSENLLPLAGQKYRDKETKMIYAVDMISDSEILLKANGDTFKFYCLLEFFWDEFEEIEG